MKDSLEKIKQGFEGLGFICEYSSLVSCVELCVFSSNKIDCKREDAFIRVRLQRDSIGESADVEFFSGREYWLSFCQRKKE